MRNGYIEEGLGRSPYGERGLKYSNGLTSLEGHCRSPYGERGLKFFAPSCQVFLFCRSPYGRAWIEIRTRLWRFPVPVCRSPYGERGLKCQDRSAGYRRCQVALLTESVD